MILHRKVKAKARKGSAKGEKDDIEFYHSVLKLGIPEVDKVIEDHGFHELEPYQDFCERTSPKEENMEDHISRMPDDILQFIISLLTMREGASTGILSRRWRNLWCKSVSRLVFKDTHLLGYDYPRDFFLVNENELRKASHKKCRLRIHRVPRHRRIVGKGEGKGFLESQRAMFIRRVNQILKLRQALTIDDFLVFFPMGDESATHIDRWMKLAAAQGVKKLELDFDWVFYNLWSDHDNRYEFPVQRFGPSLSYLSLSFCVFDFPPHFKGLSSLVSLKLNETSLSSTNVKSILSNCPSLELLSLRCCEFPFPTILEFVGPSIPLKHLNIYCCQHLKEIKLHHMNLLSFELVEFDSYFRKKLSIKNLPHLARLVLYADWPVEIVDSVPSLETLFFKHKPSKLPMLSAFNNIKRLVFTAVMHAPHLFKVVCLLEICPLLQQLEIDMGTFPGTDAEPTEESTKISMLPRCPHNNLNEVLIYAFENNPEQMELVRYLLKNAVMLEKMKIYTTCKSYCSDGLWRLSENGKLVGKALEKVRELLQKEARPFTELLIVTTSVN